MASAFSTGVEKTDSVGIALPMLVILLGYP
jgi:hypothetical protein